MDDQPTLLQHQMQHFSDPTILTDDERVAHATLKPVCRICGQELDNFKSYISHVAKHMESIALAALPQNSEDSEDELSVNSSRSILPIMLSRSEASEPMLPSIRDQLGDFRPLGPLSPPFPDFPKPVSPLSCSTHLRPPSQAQTVHSPYHHIDVAYSDTRWTTTEGSIYDVTIPDTVIQDATSALGSFTCDYPGCKASPFMTQDLLNS